MTMLFVNRMKQGKPLLNNGVYSSLYIGKDWLLWNRHEKWMREPFG